MIIRSRCLHHRSALKTLNQATTTWNYFCQLYLSSVFHELMIMPLTGIIENNTQLIMLTLSARIELITKESISLLAAVSSYAMFAYCNWAFRSVLHTFFSPVIHIDRIYLPEMGSMLTCTTRTCSHSSWRGFGQLAKCLKQSLNKLGLFLFLKIQ